MLPLGGARWLYFCVVMKKVKNTIPVYDICTLEDHPSAHEFIIAEQLKGYLERHTNLHFPHRHSFYHMVLFTSGSGTHTIDFEQFSVVPGQVYFMVPGQVHTWKFAEQPDGYILNFSDQFFRGFLVAQQYLEQFHFFKGVVSDSVFQLSTNIQAETVNIMDKIIAEL